MNLKKTAAATAVAALALPAVADAKKPADPGAQGKAKAEQQRSAKAKKQSQKKAKGVGFTLSGVDLAGLTVTDGKLAGPVTLDPTAANKHARTFLKVTAEQIAGEDTVQVGTAGDAVRVRFVGLTASDTVLPTDVVKVIGKVTKVRKGDTTTVRTLDIRKITVTRGGEQETETQPAPTTGS